MTLGGKIREARRKSGFSQEQLAEKMSVSRSAVAKWETDKGLPDVGNLKVLARLLNVSVDQLLDEGETSNVSVIREKYNIASYGYGCSRMIKDRVVREKYPDAEIFPLLARQEPEQMQIPLEYDCRSNPADQVKQTDKSFYLVERDSRQFLVTVTDIFVEVRLLEQTIEGNSFCMDGWKFIKYTYALGF